jgi:hypothetical protein
MKRQALLFFSFITILLALMHSLPAQSCLETRDNQKAQVSRANSRQLVVGDSVVSEAPRNFSQLLPQFWNL